MIAYFTGTGNSKYVAQRIADKLQDEIICINEKIKTEDTGKVDIGERLVVVVPTYAWRIPHIVSEWMEKTNFAGAKKVWYVMTCGGSVGNADAYNKKLSKQKKFQHMGTAQIVMPENYIAMFGVPTVEEARKTVKAAEPDIDKAAEMIAGGKYFPERNCKLQDRIESGPVNAVFYPVFVKAKAFMVGDSCIGCGKCAKVCPLNNVTLKDGKPVWGNNCTHCMACICYCPAEAIEYGKNSVGKPRYRFEALGIGEKRA